MPAILVSPIAKLLGLLAVLGALIGIGEWHGRKAVQQQWDAAVSRQAMAAANTVIQAAQNTATIETKYDGTVRAQTERVRVVTKEVVKYVESPAQKCTESPEFVRAFDAISRLSWDPADRLPSPADATGAPATTPEAPVTDAAVLAAYQRAVVELAALWDAYAALVEWTRSSHTIAKAGAGR